MNRIRLRNGGRCRRKALFGADGAIMAAATLAAAGMNTAATLKASSQQAKATIENAKSQAEAIKAQSENNTNLQKENIEFTKVENEKNREQQQQIQMALQMMSGQQNANDAMERNKVAVKYGGRPKRRLADKNSNPSAFYGGALPFRVTDGGGVIPISVDGNGYGLYELYGNDHEHYHKSQGGNYKSGVGIKFNDGSIVEGEGNQNSNKGEKLFVTPNDAMFISKHSIKGFNPSDAVDAGMPPEEAFNIQQAIKAKYGIKDNGSKRRLGGSRCRKANGGSFMQNHAGAIYSAAGNLAGAGVSFLGNMIGANNLAKAYSTAGNILADSYRQMKTIDPSIIKREDFTPAHAMAAIRTANTNVNPQLERIRRNSEGERRLVNSSTVSSAARQQRLAGINDRAYQRMSEIESNKQAIDDRIKSENARLITAVSGQNTQLDAQANAQYAGQKLSLAQYNNNIENAKISGIGQALANAGIQGTQVKSQAFSSGMEGLGSAIMGSAQGFSNSIQANKKMEIDYNNILMGLDNDKKVETLTNTNNPINKTLAQSYYDTWSKSSDSTLQGYAKRLDDIYGFSKVLNKKVTKLKTAKPVTYEYA